MGEARSYSITKDYIDRLIKFSESSLTDLMTESEKSTVEVLRILNILLSEAQRVSHMSVDSLATVGKLKDKLEVITSSSQPFSEGRELVQMLKDLTGKDKKIDEFVFPVMEALQFQDRIRQNVENFARMLVKWSQYRGRLEVPGEDFEAFKQDFGKSLLECTTMAEERDIIHGMIAGLPKVEERTDGVMF